MSRSPELAIMYDHKIKYASFPLSLMLTRYIVCYMFLNKVVVMLRQIELKNKQTRVILNVSALVEWYKVRTTNVITESNHDRYTLITNYWNAELEFSTFNSISWKLRGEDEIRSKLLYTKKIETERNSNRNTHIYGTRKQLLVTY